MCLYEKVAGAVMFCCSFAGVMLFILHSFLAAVGGLVVLWSMSTPLSQHIRESFLNIPNSQFATDAVCDGVPFSLNAHLCFWINLFESRASNKMFKCIGSRADILNCHRKRTRVGMHLWNAVIIITSRRILLWHAAMSGVQMLSFCTKQTDIQALLCWSVQ